MPGHKPIFVSLITNSFTMIRDRLYKLLLEPSSHSGKEPKNEDRKDDR